MREYKCPKCDHEWETDWNKIIYNIIRKNQPISISQLSRQVSIKRSTIRYYILILKAMGKVSDYKDLKNVQSGNPKWLTIKQDEHK